MFLFFLLSCLISYDDGREVQNVEIQRSVATQCYNFNHALKSSLKIHAMVGGESAGHGSGNYFKVGKHKFILTAAHVAYGPDELVAVDNTATIKLNVVYIDPFFDVAILAPEKELTSIKAKDYRPNIKENLVGQNVTYAGFPDNLPKSAFFGMVSTSNNMYIVMQSFAIPGASGSAVFDKSGKVIGVLSAIKTGGYAPFPQLFPGMVFVERVSFIDRDFIKGLFENAKGSDSI